jgi:hypothetical protein
MLAEKDLQSFIKNSFSNTILEQAHHQKTEKNYRSYHFTIDLFDVIKNQPKIAGVIIGNYPNFIQTIEKTIQ